MLLTLVSTETFTQDNQLVNPYPHGLALDNSALTAVVNASSNVFAPGDSVVLFSSPAQASTEALLLLTFTTMAQADSSLLVGINQEHWHLQVQ